MKKFHRYDVQKLDGYEVTPQGFLRIPVYAARTGIQTYQKKKDDGSFEVVREYRPPEEVFSERTMGSLRSCPMTNDHPTEMVNSDNAKSLMCGFTVDHAEKIDDKFLKTYVVVYDKNTIEQVKSGKREVSMGYDVELDFTSGEVDGQKYDAVQRNIVHNHIALVDRARGGREVRLRLDGQDAILVNEYYKLDQEGQMPKIKIGDKEFEVAQDLADAFEAFQKQMDEKLKDVGEVGKMQEEMKKADAKATELEGKNKTLTTEKDALQAKVDSLEADKTKAKNEKMDQATIELAVKERRRIDRVAEKVLSEEEYKKADEMTALELKKAVINAECKDADLKDKSQVYVDARFDHIAEGIETSGNANKKAGLSVVGHRKDAGSHDMSDSEKARQKSMKEDSEAWTKPLGKSAN